MKRILCAAATVAVVAALLSCAGFPEPKSEGNSLIIGSLVLDFPDGFFDTPPQEFDMNVKLTFRNTTKGSKFDLYTKRGFFYFQSNGTDEYVFEEFNLQQITIGTTRYSFSGDRVNIRIATTPGTVIYLGNILYTYLAPEGTKRSGRTTYYNYEPKVSVNWDRDILRQYIAEKQGDSPWLAMEVVDYGKKK